MKTLLLLSLMLFASAQNYRATYVYICMGPQSECYHKSPECRGIKNCSKKIKKVTLNEAIELYRRRPCGYCYKRR